MQIIDGKKVSAQVKQEVKNETELLKKEYSITPGLAVVIVGDDPASRVYVNNKKKAPAAAIILNCIISRTLLILIPINLIYPFSSIKSCRFFANSLPKVPFFNGLRPLSNL